MQIGSFFEGAKMAALLEGAASFNPLTLFGKYGASGLYIPDFNPARLATSGLGRLRTTSIGEVAVVAVADPIGLVLEESQGAALGADIFAPLNFASGWTAVGSGQAVDADSFGTTGVGAGGLTKSFSLVTGAAYILEGSYVKSDGSTAWQIYNAATQTNAISSPFTAASGTFSSVFIAAHANLYVRLNGASVQVDLSGVTLKPVAGFHANQATAGSRGTLRQVGSRYVWRGDGTDDNLLTTLAPAASMTALVGVEMDAVSDKAFGASVGTNFFSGGTDASGLATAYIGSTVVALSAASIVDVPGVIAISAAGSSYYAFWKPFSGPAEGPVTGTFAGAIPTTQNLRLGAENDDGTAAGFHAGDNYAALIMRAQASGAEIAAVANVFSR